MSDIFDTIKEGMDATLGKVKGLFKGDAWTVGKKLLVLGLVLAAAFWAIGKFGTKGEEQVEE